MKAELINPFLQAAVHVLSTMASLKTEANGKPYLKKDRQSFGDISGIIGLTGEKKGSVVLSFTKECALNVMSSMLGETHTELNSEVSDAVGELTNMIAGDARRRLAEIGMVFEAGIPSIIIGKEYGVESVGNGPCVVIPLKAGGHEFVIEAFFDS